MNATQTSYPRNKIKVLLLEGISDAAVSELEAGGYTEIERINGALSEEQLIAAVKGVHLLGIRSKSQISATISLKIAAKRGSACLAACKTSSCVILVSSSRMPISVMTLMAKTGSPI